VIPTLPQNDSSAQRRKRDLADARDRWTYDYSYLEGIALVKKVPREDEPSVGWWAHVGETFARILLNTGKVLELAHRTFPEDPEHKTRVEGILKGDLRDFGHVLEELKGTVLERAARESAQSINAFSAFFQEWSTPPIVASYQTDAEFARMRVAGPNPNYMQRVRALPADFPVTDAHYQSVMGTGDSLAEALAEGRTFLADYTIFEGFPTGTFPHGAQKYISAPYALFAIAKAGLGVRALTPIAIQCRKTPADDNPIFTPADGMAWTLARSAVQTADGNVHQAVTHLAHTHLVIEPFAIAARRQLSPEHPVMVLLEPHIEGTMNINYSAHASLMAPGGGVDSVLSGTIEASRAAAVSGVKTYRFDDAIFPTALARSGVDDAALLPDHPYRDDGTLLWNAVLAWVSSYVRIYYASDADVVADYELQAWWSEVRAEDGGRIAGMSDLVTVSYLATALAHVVFTASCQHAAVNFPQVDLMAYVPNVPLAQFTPAPTKKDGYTEEHYLAQLPPLDVAHMQNSLGFLLGSVHYTKLGEYDCGLFGHFKDSRVEAPLATFKNTLEDIERTITERNGTRVPYVYLLPSRVPQSINI